MMYIDELNQFGLIYGKEVFTKEILPFYIKFSKDSEDEMKIIAARNMPDICKVIEISSFKTQIVPLFNIFNYNEDPMAKGLFKF